MSFSARSGVPVLAKGLAALLVLCLAAPAMAERLVVGTELGFPPYADADAQGRPTGFSVELFDAVAKAVGVTVEYRVSEWDAAWNGLLSGRLQALPLVAKTPERSDLLEYTSTHTFGYDAFFVRKEHPPITSIQQARGNCIIVMRSDAAHHALQARGFGRELVLVASLPDAMRQLASGPCASVLAPVVQGRLIVRNLGLDSTIEAGPALAEYRREFTFATRKGDVVLRDRLEVGLQAVMASGEYQRIYDKWLGLYDATPGVDWRVLGWSALAGGAALAILGLWSGSLYRSRRQAKLALARYRAYFDQPLVGVAVTTPDMAWLEANDRLCAILGRTRAELFGTPWAELTHPDDVGTDLAQHQRVLKGEIGGYTLEKRFLRPDGTVVPCDLSVSGARDPGGGKVAYCVILIQDISERRQAQADLRVSEERLRLAMLATNDVIWDWDVQADTQTWNAAGKLVFGWTDIVERPQTAAWWVARVHPDDRERVSAGFHAAVDDPDRVHWQDDYRFQCSNGRYAHVFDRGFVQRDAAGRAVRMIGAMQDVSMRMEAEASLRLSEARLKLATESAGIGVWDLDLATQHLVWDASMLHIYGVEPDRFLGAYQAWCQALHPDDREQAIRVAEQAMAAGGAYEGEFRIVRPDGEVRHIKANATIVREGDGPGHMIGVNLDMTSLMVAREALEAHKTQLERLVGERTAEVRASVEQTRLILESSADGIIGVDVEGRVTLVNPAACRMLGHAAEALMGGNLHDTIHNRWADGTPYPATECPVLASVRLGREYRQEVDTFWRADGSALLVSLATRPMVKDGRVVGAVVSFSDVSARQHAEAALRESEARFREVADATPALIWMSGPDKLCNYLNRGWLEFTGRALEQELGSGWTENVHPDDVQGCLDSYAGAFGRRQPFSTEYRLRRRDGAYRWILDHGVPRFDGAGAFVGYIGACIDIEDIKQAEQAREEARQAAERLAHVKSEFLANMSHEIRTPLNGVLGLAQIGLRESRNRTKTQETFSRILDSGKLLLNVINDILDFSKIEAGKLNMESLPFSPRDVIADTVALTSERAEARGIHLSYRFDPSLPEACQGDSSRLSQVLLNLLSNAIKFTERGEVAVDAGLSEGALRFVVSDTGIGMSAEQLARLFTPFEQADASTTRRFGGTGLGLAISKRLLDLMGGTIAVTSSPGAGTRFEIRLPYVPASPLPVGSRSPGSALVFGRRLAGLHLLLAEDNEVNQMVLESMLSGEGASVTLVDNGRAALERVEQAPGAFDAVLMDVQMPEMDGREATRRIGRIAPDLPVIGQTAHALAEEHAECLAAGMVDTVTKPIDLDKLLVALARHVRRMPPAHVSPAQPGTPPAAPAGAPMLDYGRLLEAYGGRREMVDRLLHITLTSYATAADGLRRAAASGDTAAIRRVAHDLKGVGGNLRAEALAACAHDVELAWLNGGDLAPLAETLASSLEAFLGEVRERTPDASPQGSR